MYEIDIIFFELNRSIGTTIAVLLFTETFETYWHEGVR